jgi:hypothetical protein
LLCPSDGVVEIRLEMNNWLLSSLILKIGMVAPVQQEKHYRTGTKIKRHVLAHGCARMTGDFNLSEAPLFDVGHAHKVTIQVKLNAPRIRIQAACRDDLPEVVDMRNVIDLDVCGRRHIAGK